MCRKSAVSVEREREPLLAPRSLGHVRDAELQISDALGGIQLTSQREIECGPFAEGDAAKSWSFPLW